MSTAAWSSPPSLGRAVRTALDALNRPAPVPVALDDGRVEDMLRGALDAHLKAVRSDGGAVSAAVRTACASMAVREWEDAYLALCTAADHLRDPRPD